MTADHTPERVGEAAAFLAVVGMLSLASACTSAHEPPAGCDRSVPVSADATVSAMELHTEICRFWARCLPDVFRDFHGGDEASCIAYYQCQSRFPDSWRVTTQCIDAMRAASCEDDAIGIAWGWDCTIGGPLPRAAVGERCDEPVCRGDPEIPWSNVSCAEGSFCGADGRCVAYRPTGASCVFPDSAGLWDECETAAFCDFRTSRCAPRLADGDACAILISPRGREIDPCLHTSYCADGTCTARVTPAYTPGRPDVGEPCSDALPDCLAGLACTEGTCAPIVCGGTEGDPCVTGSCADDHVCLWSTARCERRGPWCDTDDPVVCPEGTECSPETGTCQSRG